jgi:cysteine desulfuration protein SufE
MSKNMDTIQDEIIADFSQFNDWFAAYEYLIKKGRSLEQLDETLKSEATSIGSCQSNVWIYAEWGNKGIHYSADSDSLLVKGLISLLFDVVNDQNPEDIIKTQLYFIEELQLDTHLSPSRLTGLHSIIKKIKTYAKDYSVNHNDS